MYLSIFFYFYQVFVASNSVEEWNGTNSQSFTLLNVCRLNDDVKIMTTYFCTYNILVNNEYIMELLTTSNPNTVKYKSSEINIQTCSHFSDH